MAKGVSDRRLNAVMLKEITTTNKTITGLISK
jgi:hypothetical protein